MMRAKHEDAGQAWTVIYMSPLPLPCGKPLEFAGNILNFAVFVYLP